MQNLRAIRQRIRSVQNTQKITRAMQMVAGAKLRRLHEELSNFRLFADRLDGMLDRLLEAYPNLTHPFLEEVETEGSFPSFLEESKPKAPVGLVLITSDTGLCGTYNERVGEEAQHFLKENPSAPVVAIGRKGAKLLARLGHRPAKEILDWGGRYHPDRVKALWDWMVACFQKQMVSGWAVAYTEFFSAMRWKPHVVRLFPLPKPSVADRNPLAIDEPIVEPNLHQLTDILLIRTIQARFTRMILEAFTAEHSARMVAMKNATDNAGELVEQLILIRNKVRQAAITKELIEVVSGAEALK